jgi:phospholipase C
MPPGLDALKHIVVLMMSGRSFDHMLGSLKAVNPQIDGVDGTQANPDIQGSPVLVQPLAQFQGQLDPGPDSAFAAVDQQIFAGDQSNPRVASMQGFVQNYFQQTQDLAHSQRIMYYFSEDKLSVLTSLATNFAVFNRWFASIPGPAIGNRAFAHYGTSFGQVGMDDFYPKGKSIYERLQNAGHTSKVYSFDYFNQANSAVEVVNLLQRWPQFSGTYNKFVTDCKSGTLPDYSFIHPNYTEHLTDDGLQLASDQHPDHNVEAGELYIASVYNAIHSNPALWASTALLVVYDEHGGIFDHVPPPACAADGYSAGPTDTQLNYTFNFDRLGVRVPAILISPWVPKGTVVSAERVFEHASIPATVTNHFIGNDSERTPREQGAQTFLDLLSLPAMRTDAVVFTTSGAPRSKPPKAQASSATSAKPPAVARAPKRARPAKGPQGDNDVAAVRVPIPTASSFQAQPSLPTHETGPSTHVARDRWTTDDSLGHYPYAYAIYRFLTDPETKPPLAVSIQAPWGGGKTSLMRMIQAQLDPYAMAQIDQTRPGPASDIASASVKQVLTEMAIANPQTERTEISGATGRPSWFHFFTKSRASRLGQPTVPLIEKPGQRRVTVWFNAWKYESTAQVWAGLADCIVQQIGKRLGPVERELFWFRLQLRRLDPGKIRVRIHDEILSSFIGKVLSWFPAYLGGLAALGFAMFKRAWLPAGGLFTAELFAGWVQFWRAKANTEEQPARISLGDFVQAPDYAANRPRGR